MKSAILLALLVPAAASATPTGEFVARWQAASQVAKPASGTPNAGEILARPEIKALLEEFMSAAMNYRRQILDARAAGRPPRACPPKEFNVTTDAVLADIRALPPEWQSRDFADSLGATIDRRYPCTGKEAKR